MAAGEGRPLGHRPLGDLGQAVVPGPLPDSALHVRVLVLDDAGHQGVLGVEQVAHGLARVADEAAQEVVFGQQDVLDRVRRQEPVLGHEPGRLAVLGDAAGDGGQVRGFLAVAGEEHAPAAVGDAHHVVVAGVDVQALAGQGASPDVEDDRQALAGDDVQDFLHQDEALSGGEVRDPAARQGEAFGG